jgi:hypothetical protein
MRKIKFWTIGLLFFFALIQFIKPDYGIKRGETESGKLMTGIPDSIESVFRNSCYDCHSNQTQLQWYDKITPVNFLVASDIKKGRKALNFSDFDSLNSKQVSAKLYYALNKSLSGEMPLPSYTLVHPGSTLTEKEQQKIKSYLKAISPRKLTDSAQLANNSAAYTMLMNRENEKSVQPTPNGIQYIPNYRTWKAISTTDRFDNGSMRIIYANDVAVKAIESGNINPWPDGSIFAKAAWWQQIEKDGTIRIGKFAQIEFMIKDAKKYAGTYGWGWARWRGDDLKPYGKDVHFGNECMTCHRPVKNTDYVFTAPLQLNDLRLTK